MLPSAWLGSIDVKCARLLLPLPLAGDGWGEGEPSTDPAMLREHFPSRIAARSDLPRKREVALSDDVSAAVSPALLNQKRSCYPFARRAGEGCVAWRVGTSQMSSAYSRMVRSEENHAIRATLRMPARVQAEPARQRASMPRWAS